MKQLLRKMSADELQELVDLIAGCTCSNVVKKAENEEATGEKLVQSNIKDYFDIIILNFETLNKSVKEYKDSIEDYILEKEQEFSETMAELSALTERQSKGYDVEKSTIDKLNKQVNDLAKIIQDKAAGKKKETPGRKPTPGAAKPGRKPTPPKLSAPIKVAAGAAGVITAGGMIINSKFNPTRVHPKSGKIRPHEGTDFRARTPKKLYSINEGKVIFAGKKTGYGNYILIEHSDVRSAYAHLSEIFVKPGEIVKRGQLIGKSGNTGIGTGAHLHFEIRKKDNADGGLGTAIDPESYFNQNSDVHPPMMERPQENAKSESLNRDTTNNNLIDAIAKTIRFKESRGDYTIENKQGSSASGAYQFLDDTWQALTRSYGIGTKFSRAKDAPPEIQDAVAKKRIQEILKMSKGDVSKVPVAWYTGNIKGRSKTASPEVVTAYQKDWMANFKSIMPEKRNTTAAADNASAKLTKQERTIILPVILGYK